MTTKMTTEQREAFADAVDRYRATLDPGEAWLPVDRWWRDPADVVGTPERVWWLHRCDRTRAWFTDPLPPDAPQPPICGGCHTNLNDWFKATRVPAGTPSKDLWDLLGSPKPGFCCQDAYASSGKPETLHTGGCPRRCSKWVRGQRGLIAHYPCALTVGHDGECWLHPAYRATAAGGGEADHSSTSDLGTPRPSGGPR